MNNQSITLATTRMVKGYIRPAYFRKFMAYREMEELKQSEAVNQILKHFFDDMPKDKKEKINTIVEQQLKDTL